MITVRRSSPAANFVGYEPYPIRADVDNDRFILERRSDGQRFLYIGDTVCKQSAKEWAGLK